MIGNLGIKTVREGLNGFFAWPKEQVILADHEEVTPPTTKPKVSEPIPGPKLQPKRKSYVSSAEVLKQARGPGKIQKALTYNS